MGTPGRVDKGRAQGCQDSRLAGGTDGLGWDDAIDRKDGSAYFPGKGGVHFAALWAEGVGERQFTSPSILGTIRDEHGWSLTTICPRPRENRSRLRPVMRLCGALARQEVLADGARIALDRQPQGYRRTADTPDPKEKS